MVRAAVKSVKTHAHNYDAKSNCEKSMSLLFVLLYGSVDTDCYRWRRRGSWRSQSWADRHNWRRRSCSADVGSWQLLTIRSDRATARRPPSETWFQRVVPRKPRTESSSDCLSRRSSRRRRQTIHLAVFHYKRKRHRHTLVYRRKPHFATATGLCVTDRASVQPTPQTKFEPTDFDLQPYSHRQSLSAVFIPVIQVNVITWITNHLPTLKRWKAEFAYLADP